MNAVAAPDAHERWPGTHGIQILQRVTISALHSRHLFGYIRALPVGVKRP